MVCKMELILFEIAVLFSFAGFYFGIKALLSFRNTPDDILRAKVFLTKNFLHNNFVIILIVGCLVFLHTILEFLEYGFEILSIPFTPTVRIIYALTLPIITFLLSFLAYYWNNALLKKMKC